MRRPRASFVSVLCALVGCGEPELILSVDDMTLVALDGPCAPADAIDRIDVTALGDFPASEALVATLEPGQSEERITRFPLDTELLTVRAISRSWEGVATPAYLRGDVEREVLLLPLGRSCELPPAEINLPVEAAAAALAGGSFLIAGGAVSEPTVSCPDGTVAGTRRAVVVGPDGRVASVIALLTPRLGATATYAKGRAVIVGGSSYQCDAALDTFEMLDPTRPNPVFETFRLCPDELECVGRRDHGAGVLADGRILVYGGVQRAGPAGEVLDTGLIVDPAEPHVVRTDLNYEIEPGTLMPPRRFAQILTLDNGLTIVTGGRGARDAIQEWQGEAYAFDPRTNRFTRVDTGTKDDKFYPTMDGTGARRIDPVPASCR